MPEEAKRRRNNELLAVQNSISEEDHRQFIGRTVEVLVEGPSKHAQKFDRDEKSSEGSAVANLPHDDGTQDGRRLTEVPGQPTQLVGRTMCDRIVVFEGNRRLIGQTLPVVIYDCTPMTLFGEQSPTKWVPRCTAFRR